jgi:polar amino acid transport system permease protein
MIRPFGSSEFLFLVTAVRWTLLLSAIAFIGGGIVGLAIALLRTSANRTLRLVSGTYVQLFQGTPLLMQLFLVFFGLPLAGFHIDSWFAAGVALTLHASAFLGEIWRGCINSIPSGQSEASDALGLSYYHKMRYVILPQALKISLPPTVGFLVQLIKATSLTSIIGFVELTRAGVIINNATFRPFLVFGIVASIYFIICYPLSQLSRNLEARLVRVQQRQA